MFRLERYLAGKSISVTSHHHRQRDRAQALKAGDGPEAVGPLDQRTLEIHGKLDPRAKPKRANDYFHPARSACERIPTLSVARSSYLTFAVEPVENRKRLSMHLYQLRPCQTTRSCRPVEWSRSNRTKPVGRMLRNLQPPMSRLRPTVANSIHMRQDTNCLADVRLQWIHFDHQSIVPIQPRAMKRHPLLVAGRSNDCFHNQIALVEGLMSDRPVSAAARRKTKITPRSQHRELLQRRLTRQSSTTYFSFCVM
jgi:hypothetical protein